jgi:hypothetical protein
MSDDRRREFALEVVSELRRALTPVVISFIVGVVGIGLESVHRSIERRLLPPN